MRVDRILVAAWAARCHRPDRRHDAEAPPTPRQGQTARYSAAMCNLYHLAPRLHVETYFRVQLAPEYRELAVGPFNTGLFLRPAPEGLAAVFGQWGMIAPGSKTRRPTSRAILTNNARAETVDSRPTYRQAWRGARRCLIPAAWYQEPNWETGKNIWWRLRRADGEPWALAGLWSEWTDPESGEIVPSYTMITINCDGHPAARPPAQARPQAAARCAGQALGGAAGARRLGGLAGRRRSPRTCLADRASGVAVRPHRRAAHRPGPGAVRALNRADSAACNAPTRTHGPAPADLDRARRRRRRRRALPAGRPGGWRTCPSWWRRSPRCPR
jgi:putative SOS response-associated peptidase YedK